MDAQVRGTAFQRGYDGSWKIAREAALTKAGIPKHLWRFYQVHHSPAYPSLGKDHSLYTLTPMPTGEHSSETDRTGGGFGNKRQDELGRVQHEPDAALAHRHVYEGDDFPSIG